MTTISIRQHLQRLIGGLILAVGLILSVVSYLQLSQLAEQEMGQHTRSMARQSAQAIDGLFLPSTTLLTLLAEVPDLRSGRLDDWLLRLPAQAAALRANPVAVSVYVAGPQGQYLLLRELREAADQAAFQAPPLSRYLVQAQRVRPSDGTDQHWLFFDADFQLVDDRLASAAAGFDPRERPWFGPALRAQGVVRTAPYTFFSTGKTGISLSHSAGQGWVVGMDIRLDSLAPKLAAIAADRSARLWLVDASGTLIAANLDDKETAALLPSVQTVAAADTQTSQWVHDPQGNAWLVQGLPVAIDRHVDMRLLVAMPRSQLFGPALAVRNTSLALTAVLLVLALWLSWRSARRFSAPLKRLSGHVQSLVSFNFSGERAPRSRISELDELSQSFEQMRLTLDRFLALLRKVSGEADLERLLPLILDESAQAVESDASGLYLSDAADDTLRPRAQQGGIPGADWPARWRAAGSPHGLLRLTTDGAAGEALLIPLLGRRGNPLGLMVFERSMAFSEPRARFAEALSGFAALALESRELIAQQKQLFESFIKLIADAVDAKSPHTGGHCHRVPVLTEMLVDLADRSDAPAVADFHLNPELREAVHIGAWLHDCGKVATPEYVVDKATKLETIYNRIHEIRLRFELCKRERELAYWKAVGGSLDGTEQQSLTESLQQDLDQLDEDFRFVAECNIGDEAMSPDRVQRLQRIALHTWTRTLDDSLGLSQDERRRREGQPERLLPALEPLLSDRPEHRVPRPPGQRFDDANPWGFRMPVPEWLYDQGELKNLSIARGTLTDEERYKINEHIVLTIRMLEALPFPRHLSQVAEIAGGHHERMDGRGYPRALPAGSMSVPARLMAIADVFEALTASDRPYKQGKTVDQALAIMRGMVAQQHLDPELFALFAGSEVPRHYAERFLAPWQLPAAAG